jgi:hypothetical protein
VVFPALVQLALESCTMPLAVFQQLQHATALTSLTLHGFTITNTEEDKPKASRSDIAAAITDLISHLPSLEHLDFRLLVGRWQCYLASPGASATSFYLIVASQVPCAKATIIGWQPWYQTSTTRLWESIAAPQGMCRMWPRHNIHGTKTTAQNGCSRTAPHMLLCSFQTKPLQ